jgi:hypothetical protein
MRLNLEPKKAPASQQQQHIMKMKINKRNKKKATATLFEIQIIYFFL